MGGRAEQGKVDRRPEDCPTAWFVVLERARDVGDFERAAEAQRELRRLGVQVRFSRVEGGARG